MRVAFLVGDGHRLDADDGPSTIRRYHRSSMAERSAPIVVTPHACPFLALEGDRDRRLDVPDPLHRCFAEQTPRPRSIGHQEHYCLAPAFTTCPIFLDWAGRVGAEPAPPSVARAGSTDGPISRPAVSVPVAGDEAHDDPPPGERMVEPAPWAVAPSWVEPTSAAVPTSAAEPGAAAVPGSAAPVGSSVMPSPSAVPSPSVEPASSAVPGLAGRPMSEETSAERAAELAAWRYRTDLLIGAVDPDTDTGSAGFAGGVPAVVDAAATTNAPDGAGRDDPDGAAPTATDAPDGDGPAPPWSRGRPGVPIDATSDPTVRTQARPVIRTTGSREWEGARRFEAYAATRQGLPRPLIAVAGVGILALVLLLVFLLPSAFLGGATGSPTPDPSASAATATTGPRSTPQPTATGDAPEGTPRAYRVRSGDTLTRISKRFGVSVEVIQCANRIRNPNSLSLGQRLVIPPKSFRCGDDIEEP